VDLAVAVEGIWALVVLEIHLLHHPHKEVTVGLVGR
jgi:hypothetical protein